ncbi:hypothetical protein GGH92_010167, partial [Coemansia sp. RSA 2673]
ITKIAAVPEPGAAASGDGRPSPRVNSDPQVKSPRQEHMPESLQLDAPPMLHPPPPLTRIRSASSPRFTTSDVASGALLSANSGGGVSALAIDDDEFEML